MAFGSVLGVRTIRRRLSRFTLTAVGVALGIGVLFAVLITNSTIDTEIQRNLTYHSRPVVQLEPAAGAGSGLPASIVDAAARLNGVASVSSGVAIAARVPRDNRGKDTVFLYSGVYRKGSATPRPQPPRPEDILLRGADAKADDEVVLSPDLAKRLHAEVGSTVRLDGPVGPLQLRVVGTYRNRDGSTPNGEWGNITFAAAAHQSARGEVIDQASIELGSKVDVSDWIGAHGDDLGATVHLYSGSIDAQTYRQVLNGGKAALAGLAGVALFVSGFLIFLTQSIGVAEAAATHGTLRAIGASRTQVRRVVLTDAVSLTVIAAPAGLLLGFLAAVAIIRVTRGVYGLPHLGYTLHPISAVIAVAVGVVVTFVAALVPARRAASIEPIEAIRSAGRERAGLGRGWIGGVAALVIGGILVVLAPNPRVDVGSFAMLVGAVLLAPVVMGPVTALAGRATRPLARGVGHVGVLHLRKEPRRAAHTVALLMIVLGMVFTSGAAHLSLRRNLVTTLSQRFPADLTVQASGAFTPDLRQKVVDTPGVRAATDIRFTRLFGPAPVGRDLFVTVLDPTTFFAVQGLPWAAGDDQTAQRALARGGSVLIPTSLRLRSHVHLGDRLALDTPVGRRTFRVAGVYNTYDNVAPVMLGLADGPTVLGQTSSSAASIAVLAVAVKSGVSPSSVKMAIYRRMASGASPVFIRETSTQKAEFVRNQTTFFNLVYALVLIALVMGMLGVTNTLVMAVLRRNREIGILRAVGTERRYLRRMAAVESATIAGAGLLLSIPLGFLLSFTVLRSVAHGSGIVVDYVFPWPMFAVVAPLALLVAVVSSIVPGRHAARVDPARVLRFD